MSDFDVTVAIAEFLADESRSSFELPHMTTGQRKKAKIIVDGYPEIRCESFGFGAERQLHLFKIEADVALQKLAPHMATCSEQALLKASNSEFRRQCANERADSPDCSTHASTVISDVSVSRNATDRGRQAESMQAMSFINVRNTFINLETSSIDERTVQSMPHGMFGKCMLAELSQKRRADQSRIEEETQSNNVVADKMAFSVGTLVIVDGLVKAPMFNGLSAVVEGWDEATERYRILIGSIGGSQQAMVKKTNLKLVSHCP
jgi:hypothetical protein